jgi:hypothetical protein
MIKGAHVLISSTQPEPLRSFFRDTLGLAVLGDESWPVFELPATELGVHDTEDGDHEGRVQFYLICDDLDATIAELAAKGVEFDGEPTDEGFAMQALIRFPSGLKLPVYQPRYRSVID